MISEMEQNNKRLIETLIRGRDSTTRLQDLLCRKENLNGLVSVEDLLAEILGSFSSGISMVNSSVSGENLGFPVENMPEVFSGNKPAVKERRGCYKRRRTIDTSVITSATIEDGFAWRKYGQKEILNSKSPRCYFRCTHKHVHGCKAQKQVQKLEDGSNMYHITYLGKHTCPSVTHHEFVLNFQDFKNTYHVSNSPSTITNAHIDPSVKQEVDSKDQSTDVSDIISSANDENTSPPLRWDEILGAGLGSCHEGASYMRFDHEDSCASTSSHGYMYMDYLNNDDLLSGGIGLLDQNVFLD
ncbi:putative transcription factor WRKY family [Helianthus debilis subsp. tardiflorus]